MTGQEFCQDGVLLGSAQKPGAGHPGQGGTLAQDAETECLMSTGHWFGRGATDPGGDAFAKVSGCGPRRRQNQALIGRDPIPTDPVEHDLDGRGGLAGAGGTQNA
jgi:hypothetical protein